MIEKTFPISEKIIDNSLTMSLRLMELLTMEAEQLKNNPRPEKIAGLASEKKDVVTKLEQNNQHLGQILTTEKLTQTPENIERYFTLAASTGFNIESIKQNWQRLCITANQCRHQNEMNGASINLLVQHNRRIQQILRGKAQTATTYGPDGSTHSERLSHALFSV